MQLADLDGDGRSDVCGRGPAGIQCALSTGKAFGRLDLWSDAAELQSGTLLFGDLNGDGREDVCGHARAGITCAFSTGRSFTKPTLWLALEKAANVSDARLGDVNGDGRVDLCARTPAGLACALAP